MWENICRTLTRDIEVFSLFFINIYSPPHILENINNLSTGFTCEQLHTNTICNTEKKHYQVFQFTYLRGLNTKNFDEML